MNKKFVTALAALCLIQSSGFAAEIKNCDISAQGVITVKETLDSKKEGANVSVMVLRPGVSVEDLTEGEENVSLVAEFNKTVSEKDGEYSFSFAIDGQSDFYECLIASDAGDKDSFKILYSNPSEAKGLIENLNNAADEEEFYNLIFGEEEGFKALAFYLSLPEEAEERAVSDLLYNYVNNNSKLDENDTKATADIYKKFYVIELLNEEKEISIEDYEKYLDTKSFKWYSFYEEDYIKDDVKEDMYSGLFGKNLKTEEDLEEDLFEQLVLKTVRFSDGYGNIRDILEEYEEYTGIETEDLTRENYNRVLGKSFDDYEELEEGLKEEPSKSQGGGGSSGGSKKDNSVIGSSGAVIGINGTETKVPDAIYYEDKNNDKFSDIANISWAKDAINALSNKGIVNGKSEKIFAPDDNITREEFAAILVRALKLSEKTTDVNFSDVSDSAWYASAIKTAVAEGIIMGKGDGSFGIGENITRQDMAVMLYRAMKLSENAEADKKFPDDEEIAEYAKKAVYSLYSEEVFSGFSDGSFKPNGLATRAQAAVVIYRAFSDMI